MCVINDCSQDRTPEILNSIQDIHVIHHKKNTHIPGALIDGMRYAIDNGYAYAISMDAGLSHDPDEIPLFINHPHFDLVIGTRTRKTDTPLIRHVLSISANIIYNWSLDFPRSLFKKYYYRDITSGYRRYSIKSMELILSKRIQSKSFDVLFETTMFVYRNGLTISELPITYQFTNSSLNAKVIKDCIKMCLRSSLMPIPSASILSS